jgi:RNA polymerase sigma-70 factor (ECF subfamily)
MESDLVQRAQGGDVDAFETLIRAAHDRLYATAHRILRERDAAEDAVQDAVLRCWRDLRGLRDVDRFEAWLYRLLVNACRDQLRHSRRRPAVTYDQPDVAMAGDDFAAVADHDALERAFVQLPADQRICLVLTHYVGYSAAEVGSILGVPTGTVYSRLHYGARAMRGALTPPPAVPAATTESLR